MGLCVASNSVERADVFDSRIGLGLYFFHQILSQGDRLKVIEPSWVVDEMHELILDALKLYDPSLCGSQ